jgi:hypothetical protein
VRLHGGSRAGVELMAGEDDGLEVLADSAYGSTRHALAADHHLLVIEPWASRPSIPGGFERDDFTVDHDERRVTCPAGCVARLSAKGVARFHPHCGACPLRSRCTKAQARSVSVSTHDEQLVAARAAWGNEELRATAATGRWPSAPSPGSWPRGTDACALAASSATKPGSTDGPPPSTCAS